MTSIQRLDGIDVSLDRRLGCGLKSQSLLCTSAKAVWEIVELDGFVTSLTPLTPVLYLYIIFFPLS